MSKGQVNLKSYNNDWYYPNAGKLKILIWLFVSSLFFTNSLSLVNAIKIYILKLFGAKIGHGVTIKPSVTIKYPWLLELGDYVWIGENAWIDNLAKVKIGNNCCLSQGAMVLTGNHNYKLQSFDLIVKEITLQEGVWIGAKATVCPGVTCQSHSVLTVASVATTDLEAYGIYQGNPAVKIKVREIIVQ